MTQIQQQKNLGKRERVGFSSGPNISYDWHKYKEVIWCKKCLYLAAVEPLHLSFVPTPFFPFSLFNSLLSISSTQTSIESKVTSEKKRGKEREREELIKYISPEKFVQTELDWKEKSFSSFSRSAPKNPWAWFIIAFLSCLCLLCSEVDSSSQIHGRGFESRFLAVISSSDACFFLNVMA